MISTTSRGTACPEVPCDPPRTDASTERHMLLTFNTILRFCVTCALQGSVKVMQSEETMTPAWSFVSGLGTPTAKARQGSKQSSVTVAANDYTTQLNSTTFVVSHLQSARGARWCSLLTILYLLGMKLYVEFMPYAGTERNALSPVGVLSGLRAQRRRQARHK